MPKEINKSLEEWKKKVDWVKEPFDSSKDREEQWKNYKSKLNNLIEKEFGNKDKFLMERICYSLITIAAQSSQGKNFYGKGDYYTEYIKEKIWNQQKEIHRAIIQGKKDKDFAEKKIEAAEKEGSQFSQGEQEIKEDEFDLTDNLEVSELIGNKKSRSPRPSHVRTVSKEDFEKFVNEFNQDESKFGKKEIVYIDVPKAPVSVVNSPHDNQKEKEEGNKELEKELLENHIKCLETNISGYWQIIKNENLSVSQRLIEVEMLKVMQKQIEEWEREREELKNNATQLFPQKGKVEAKEELQPKSSSEDLIKTLVQQNEVLAKEKTELEKKLLSSRIQELASKIGGHQKMIDGNIEVINRCLANNEILEDQITEWRKEKEKLEKEFLSEQENEQQLQAKIIVNPQ